MIFSDITPAISMQAEETIEKGAEFFENLWNSFVSFLPALITAVLTLIIGMWLSSVVKKITSNAMQRAKVEKSVYGFVIAFVNIALKLLVVITALAILGVNVTSIIAAFSAAVVAVGLAMQNSLSNIASGILIIINKPFKVGDLLEFEGVKGTVSKIELFNTFLTTFDGKEIVVPNSRLTSNNVINCCYTDTRRLDLSYTIGYNDNIPLVKSVIYNVISQTEEILSEPAPVVGVGEHGAHGVEIIVRVWLQNDDYGDVYLKMQEAVKSAFDKNGIEIPYNQIVVHKNSNSDSDN